LLRLWEFNKAKLFWTSKELEELMVARSQELCFLLPLAPLLPTNSTSPFGIVAYLVHLIIDETSNSFFGNRIVLDINTNMNMLGRRHPYQAQYKVGAMNNGKINALEFNFYADGGSQLSFSGPADLYPCVVSCDNTYYFPNFSAQVSLLVH